MTYAEFLKNVYGIDQFIATGRKSEAIESSTDVVSLFNDGASLQFVILKDDSTAFSANEKELFEKMMVALQKKSEDYSLQVTTSLKALNPTPGAVVLMSAQPQATMALAQDLGIESHISTFDPATLLVKPALKKEVWAQIQTLK